MTLAEKISLVRLLIGDIPTSPFYPLYDDTEIEKFLTLSNGDVLKAAVYAAHGASMQFSGYTTMEKTGDITVRNELASNYLKALKLLIDSTKIIKEIRFSILGVWVLVFSRYVSTLKIPQLPLVQS